MSESVFYSISDRPDTSTARLRNSESGDELVQSQPSDEILRSDIEHLIALLVQEDGWTQSDQGRFFASTMFPNIDVTSRLNRQPGGRWEQYLTVREQLIPMEEFFAVQYISKELLQVFRDESQSGIYRTSQHKYLCNLLRAVEVRCLKTTDPTSAMYFEHGTLIDIVNSIRQNATDYTEWHQSKTAKLYNPDIFVNKKNDKGYWF